MTAAADHCLALVRSADKDRFLASLFAPDAKRPLLLALYAFNIEIVRVADSVSEPHIGLIRHQWWRETVRGIYAGEVPPHPVAEELARAIAAGDLPLAPFLNLIAAREFDLYDDAMPDMTALEGYLGETSSALIQLASLLLAGPAAMTSAAAAGLAGVAHGMTGLIRGLHLHRARKFLPRGLAVSTAIDHARQRLGEARALRHTIPPAALPAFLPVSLAELYLDRAGRLGEAARDKPVEISQFRRQLRLWWKARRDSF